MEEPVRTGAIVYGYGVCLVAVITFLISTTGLVAAILDLGDPIHAGFTPPGSPSLASYENYKLDVMKSIQQSEAGNKQQYMPDETTLKAMYESARNEKIMKVQFDAKKSILLSSLMILIAVILFAAHWKWMQRMNR
jgi:hypothetical protein